MLGEQGIIEKHEAEKIVEGLKAILADIEAGQVEFSLENEDIHMNIEAHAHPAYRGHGQAAAHRPQPERPGGGGHPAVCRRRRSRRSSGRCWSWSRCWCNKAEANLHTVMPGYTHLQRAQPTTFAHYMMAYANMLRRDVTRLEDCLERMDECPLGAGAMATTTYPVDRFQHSRSCWASKSPPTTPWTRCPTGTLPSNCCAPCPS